MSTARPSAKRKRGAESSKVYAVRVGHRPGLYWSWADCLRQVTGFKGAVYKSFPALNEAQRFLAGEDTLHSQRYYAVRRGKTPGIYLDWPAAQEQIRGCPRPSFKRFDTRREAEVFLASPDELPGVHEETPIFSGLALCTQSVPTGDEAASKLRSTPLRVYTDGSALKNGRRGAVAGVGVYFGPADPRNISEPLSGARQTNQRAELTALQRALDQAPKELNLVFVTDSQYAINCVTKWSIAWQRNGWKTAAGKPVENRDLIEAILGRLSSRRSKGGTITFEWVKGHADDPGNVQADRLAVQGAQSAARS